MGEIHPMFLIAVPQLVDPNFKRSVILILHHDTEGAFGLVVNDPLSIDLPDFAQSQNLRCHSNLLSNQVFCGGPVEPYRGWILHSDEDTQEKQDVLPGLYLSGSNETLKFFMEQGVKPFRFLLGYAGWGAGQLEKELEDGSWITATPEPKYVFYDNPDDTWNGILHDMGVDPASLALGTGLH